MNLLIQQGKILYWGTSEWTGVEIMEAHRVAQQYKLIGPVVEQPQYNLFEREKMEKEFLMVFKTMGLGTTIWSPLASGLLSGKYNNGIPEGSRFALKGFDWLKDRWMVEDRIEKVKKLSVLAQELNVSTAAFSIAWCIKNPNTTTAILGATNKEQLKENLKALEVLPKLTDEVINKVEEIVQTRPVLPEF